MGKKILYLGLDPTRYQHNGNLFHFPLIEIKPKPFSGLLEKAFERLIFASHVILTSRTAVSLFCHYTQEIPDKIYITVGKATTLRLRDFHINNIVTAQHETAEGICALLQNLTEDSCVFYPHSSLSRPLIKNYLEAKKIPHIAIELYDTHFLKRPLPDLSLFDEIVFTSPSTVEAFFALTQALPARQKCLALGPITTQTLNKFY